MPGFEPGELSHAICHYLSSVGVHVRPGKLKPSQEKAASLPARCLFGVPLHSLPLSAHTEGVPQFLVDACEQLRLHLHVEGLFRKSGSATRIRALKTRLDAGESCLPLALPCDVTALVKQFLRDLPEPLVPAELQDPLCQVQRRPEKDRDSLTLLLTCLLPRASSSTLRYFFCFLQDVAARSLQNKMDVANLAVIFAPNLFSGELCCKLDGEAEDRLQTQAAVVELLISHASEIGTIPLPLLGEVKAAFSVAEQKRPSPSGPGARRGGKAESRRRQRRRSVGDIVTEALSKFKSGRALSPAPCPETKENRGAESLNDPSRRTSFHSKRKASDDILYTPELSAKKRRSALDSDCSGPPKKDVFEHPEEVGPVQDPGRPALVSCNSTPNPVSGTGGPRISTVKVQRRRSSGRKLPQRKHPARPAPCGSPTPYERKDVARKSLRFFFRGGKDPYPLPPSIKTTEPGGSYLMQKMMTEGPGGPASQPLWDRLPSHKPEETEEVPPARSSDDDFPSPPHTVQDVAAKSKTGTPPSPALDGVSCGHQERLRSGGSGGKEKNLVGNPREAVPPLRRHQLLRRSSSWPDDLSMRDSARRGETGFFPDEAAVDPSDRFGSAEPTQPGVEAIAAGIRQLGLPAVSVTLADGYGAARPENGPHDVPGGLLSSKPDPPEDHGLWADGLRRLSRGPQRSLKRFTLNFRQPSSRPNDGPRRKEGRRFGRSVSHESGLPLQAGEETGCGAKKGAASQPSKSPLQSFKACSQQFFIAHKHLAMMLVGRRGRKEPTSASPQEIERTTVDSQEPLLGCQLEGERRRYRRSPKFPLAETQLVASQDSVDL